MKIAFVFFFFILNFTFSQVPERKVWEKGHLLAWSDFQGKPNKNSGFTANTNSGIVFSYSLKSSPKNPIFTFEIRSFFYPNLSWVIPNSKSRYLLKHEQVHFDISEWYARKLRKALTEIPREQLKNNPKKTVTDLYQKFEKERVETQKKFDLETTHSLNKREEERWEVLITSGLKKLEKYTANK